MLRVAANVQQRKAKRSFSAKRNIEVEEEAKSENKTPKYLSFLFTQKKQGHSGEVREKKGKKVG